MDLTNLSATTVREEVAIQEQLNTSVNESTSAQVINPAETAEKVSRKTNPKAGWITQHLSSALSSKARDSVELLSNEELAIAEDLLKELNALFAPYFAAKVTEMATARESRKQREEQLAKLRADRKQLREQLKALKDAEEALSKVG
jgi:hypothetical protein